ncbi:MAG: hypothetical protein CMO97_05660 [Woeseia sp.]|nr:hypothetical protein [Woeseia sp.]|tara:strand:+ start:381 stop:797 length:417 start_codon:yes stop_codon:yes gene_type:complete
MACDNKMFKLMILKKCVNVLLLVVFSFLSASCDYSKGSNTIVQIYGWSEWDCTDNEFRILQQNPGLDFLGLSFIKVKKWYSLEEFHKAHYEATLEPFKDLPYSDETLSEIAPTFDDSTAILGELIAEVDCDYPEDILF